jgi:hypothetical protein
MVLLSLAWPRRVPTYWHLLDWGGSIGTGGLLDMRFRCLLPLAGR